MSRGNETMVARSLSADRCTSMIVSVQWQGAPPSRYFRFSSRSTLSRPSVPTSSRFMLLFTRGRFFMSLNGSTRSIPVSRLVTTA